jgi:hypothetical protein
VRLAIAVQHVKGNVQDLRSTSVGQAASRQRDSPGVLLLEVRAPKGRARLTRCLQQPTQHNPVHHPGGLDSGKPGSVGTQPVPSPATLTQLACARRTYLDIRHGGEAVGVPAPRLVRLGAASRSGVLQAGRQAGVTRVRQQAGRQAAA